MGNLHAKSHACVHAQWVTAAEVEVAAAPPVCISVDDRGGHAPPPGTLRVFVAIEPPCIKPAVYANLADAAWCAQWDVLAVLDRCFVHPSAWHKVTPFNGSSFTFVPLASLQAPPPMDKLFGVSTVVSAKGWAPGHKLRAAVRAAWPSEVPGIVWIGGKQAVHQSWERPYPVHDRTALYSHMFHLAIENSVTHGYWSEKLLDAMLCGAVPVYVGTSSIDALFDTSGIIRVPTSDGTTVTADDICACLRALTPADYAARREAVVENAKRARALIERAPDMPDAEHYPTLSRAIMRAQARALAAAALPSA